jgi:hypothetical protein
MPAPDAIKNTCSAAAASGTETSKLRQVDVLVSQGQNIADGSARSV